MLFQLIFECSFCSIILCWIKNKHPFKFFLWLPGIVDFKMLKIKLSVKTLNEKCKALKDIEKGLSNKDASKKYGVPPDTISTWIKNKEKYFKALEDNCSSKKQKLRESDFEKLDNVVFRWILSKRSQNVPINGNLIKQKATTYAKELGYNNFHGSVEWLDKWKKREMINNYVDFDICNLVSETLMSSAKYIKTSLNQQSSMYMWTCIPSPSPNLTCFPFIKILHKPYSSALK